MLVADLVATSAQVAETRSRKAKAERLAALLGRLAAEERIPAIAWLGGELPQRKIGVGWASVRELDSLPASEVGRLTIGEVHAAFDELAGMSGRGSANTRKQALGALWARATHAERAFLAGVLLGTLRQGGLDGIMAEGVALAARVEPAVLRRAWMLAGALPAVAADALAEGAAGLAKYALHVFTPVLPMLATPTEGIADAMGRLGEAALEDKLDGARIQVHREGDEVRIFTRGLLDVTEQLPELVAAARALPGRRVILDGETLALNARGGPLPFQQTMARFSRKGSAELGLSPFFFDVLLVDDEMTLDRPARERFAVLDEIVAPAQRIPRVITSEVAEAEAFLAAALARGHEGIMAKDLGAPYQIGSRGQGWLKVKPAHTLDLVVLAVEHGSGRRRGLLSNIHLGARDEEHGGFVMLGKTFKGMTDELLAWQTQRFRELEVSDDGWVVRVRPEQVVEIAFDGLQESPHYPGGLALRFARVKGYRNDKRADEADTIETVRAIFSRERARGG